VLFDLLMLGVFGGFFIVPLYALVQSRAAAGAPGAHHRRQQHPQCAVHGGRRAGGGALLGAGLSIPALFGVAAVLNAAVAIYIYGLVPEFLLRFIAWLLVTGGLSAAHRGLEHIPPKARRCWSATMSASSMRW
jgi:hypothetical protein